MSMKYPLSQLSQSRDPCMIWPPILQFFKIAGHKVDHVTVEGAIIIFRNIARCTVRLECVFGSKVYDRYNIQNVSQHK